MNLSIDKTGAFPVAAMGGEWRATDGDDFRDELHPLAAQAGSKLAIDLSGLEMIDSSGLSTLIGVVTHARLCNARVVLVAPASFVAGVFEVTNLDKWFEICNDMDEATKLLSSD